MAIAQELAAKHFQNVVDIRVLQEWDRDTKETYIEVRVRVDSTPEETFASHHAFLEDWLPHITVEDWRFVRLAYTFQ